MPKITISFHEEGADPITYEINEQVADRLNLYVAQSGRWTSKSQMFIDICTRNIIEPTLLSFPVVTDAILAKRAALEAAKKALEQEYLTPLEKKA